MRRLNFAILVLLSFGLGQAQQTATLNGQNLEGFNATLVSGYAYVPAERLAERFAGVVADQGDRVSLDLLGHLLILPITDAANALQDSQALSFDGRLFASTSAVRSEDGSIYVPLRPIILAFGGAVDYLSGQQKVIAIIPRSNLKDIKLSQSSRGERINLTFTGQTFYQQRFDPLSGRLRFSFEEARSTLSWQNQGSLFAQGSLSSASGYLNLDLSLNATTTYSSFASTEPNGFNVIIDLFTKTPKVTPKTLDILSDSASITFAEALKLSLEAQGVSVSLSSTSSLKMQTDASALLVFGKTDVSVGQFNLYYPQETEPKLILSQNARLSFTSDFPSGSRQTLLTDLQTDFSAMAANAEQFSRNLSALSGYQVNTLSAAPLAYSGNLPKTVLVLELGADSLQDKAFLEALSSSLLGLLR